MVQAATLAGVSPSTPAEWMDEWHRRAVEVFGGEVSDKNTEPEAFAIAEQLIADVIASTLAAVSKTETPEPCIGCLALSAKLAEAKNGVFLARVAHALCGKPWYGVDGERTSPIPCTSPVDHVGDCYRYATDEEG